MVRQLEHADEEEEQEDEVGVDEPVPPPSASTRVSPEPQALESDPVAPGLPVEVTMACILIRPVQNSSWKEFRTFCQMVRG